MRAYDADCADFDTGDTCLTFEIASFDGSLAFSSKQGGQIKKVMIVVRLLVSIKKDDERM